MGTENLDGVSQENEQKAPVASDPNEDAKFKLYMLQEGK